MTWEDDAACRFADPAAWDLDDGKIGALLNDHNVTALDVCRTCRVKTQCDADAHASNPVGTIRAGVAYTPRGPKPLLSKVCLWCGDSFYAKRGDRMYCTDLCMVAAGRQRARDRYALRVEEGAA